MASFVISTATVAAQSLASNETGYLTDAGAIVTAGTALFMSATARLINQGELAGFGTVTVLLSSMTLGALTNGGTGSILAGGVTGTAVAGSFEQLYLRNAGDIIGGRAIVLTSTVSARFTLGNDGLIEGVGTVAQPAISVALAGGGVASITNSGTIHASGTGNAIELLVGGSLFISNTGDILTATGSSATRSISAVGTLTLVNDGHIVGGISAGGAADITNSGVIVGDIFLGNSSDHVTISGRVTGNVNLGDGTNIFELKGGYVSGEVRGGAQNSQFFMDRSDIVITAGGLADTVISTVDFRLDRSVENLNLRGAGLVGIGTALANTMIGDVDCILYGKAGNDSMITGFGGVTMYGGLGDDALVGGQDGGVMDGGRGNDTIQSNLAEDTIAGGVGIDTLTMTNGLTGVTVNLATGVADFGVNGVATVSGIENVTGTELGDSLTGNLDANVLAGKGGGDVISGASGADTLRGDAGSDSMNGGGGADSFVYGFAQDSDGTVAKDRIDAFQLGTDVIDLSLIDAAASGGNDAFVFIGTAAFTGAVGEVRYVKDVGAGTTLIEVRLAGSGVDDMQILLSTALDLTTASFVL